MLAAVSRDMAKLRSFILHKNTSDKNLIKAANAQINF